LARSPSPRLQKKPEQPIRGEGGVTVSPGPLSFPPALQRPDADGRARSAGDPGKSREGKAVVESGKTLTDRREVIREASRSVTGAQVVSPPEEQAKIRELNRRHQEVRQHEAAHMASGGALVRGGASCSYVAGPDGKR